MTPYYQDDAVTLYLGDCREVLPRLEQVDHLITDPPYSRDVYMRMTALHAHAETGALGRMGIRPTGTPFSPLRAEGTAMARMAAGDIGSVNDLLPSVAAAAALTRRWVLVFSDVEYIHEWRAALEGVGLRYVRTGAWVKTDPMPQMSGDRPAVGFEPCTICHAKGKMRWNGGGKAASWTYGTVKTNRPAHPCPKPEPLMLELVQQFTDAGETILDPFAGSGTTLFAAKRIGRKAIGIEIDEKFAEVAARRLQQGALDMFTEQSA